MRAVLLEQYGPADRLTVREVPAPTVQRPTDVVVRVRAAGLNPVDYKVRSGTQRAAMRLKLPWVLGLDLAGEVVAVGPEVTWFKPGDEVMGSPDWRRPGSYAEYCVVDQAWLVRKPPRLSMIEAAGLPLAGLTAWQCLAPALQGQPPGRRVFIQAGAGGVGHLAIQIAKSLGAWVATTCSAHKEGFVRELGADHVIDYHKEAWWRSLSGLDVVLDALGGVERRRARKAVRRGGRVASIVSGLPQHSRRYGATLGAVITALGIVGFWVRGKLGGIDAANVIRRVNPDQLSHLAELANSGGLKVHVDRTYPLEEAAAAHAYAEQGHARGKVVLLVA